MNDRRQPGTSPLPLSKLAEHVESKQLDGKEREAIVELALVLLGQHEVNLPLRRAMFGVDPIQRLRLLRYELGQTSDTEPSRGTAPPRMPSSDLEFHRQMQAIFRSLRDPLTAYSLGDPIASYVAFLPFSVGEYFKKRERRAAAARGRAVASRARYIVTDVIPDSGIPDPEFGCGAELVHWNGVGMHRAVEALAEPLAASNDEARRAQALSLMTLRPLATELPDDLWARIVYRPAGAPKGAERSILFPWLAFRPPATMRPGARSDLRDDPGQRARAFMFRPELAEAPTRAAPAVTARPAPSELTRIYGVESRPTADPAALEAFVIRPDDDFPRDTGSGGGRAFALLRLRSFVASDAPGTKADARAAIEFTTRVKSLLADDLQGTRGLILDLRGNSGGSLTTAETLLQLFTPRRIEPVSLQLLSTDGNRELAKDERFERWLPSLNRSVTTGSGHSQGFPWSSAADCNRLGQHYHAPVVLVTDAACRGVAEIFIASFQDHRIGTILAVHGHTGGSGAEVVFDLDKLVRKRNGLSSSDVEMRVALFRSLRTGDNAGVALAETGIDFTQRFAGDDRLAPDELCPLSRQDVVTTAGVRHGGPVPGGSIDLYARAIQVLREQPAYMLRLHKPSPGVLRAETRNLDRLEVCRPGGEHIETLWLDAFGRRSKSLSETAAGAGAIELYGYRDGDLVAAYRHGTSVKATRSSRTLAKR